MFGSNQKNRLAKDPPEKDKHGHSKNNENEKPWLLTHPNTSKVGFIPQKYVEDNTDASKNLLVTQSDDLALLEQIRNKIRREDYSISFEHVCLALRNEETE